MKLSEIVEKIKDKKFVFDVWANEKVLFKKQNSASIENLHGSLFDYFNKIASINKVDTIGVNLFSSNGSSFLNKGFFLVETKPVVESTPLATKTVELSTKSVEPSTTLGTLEQKPSQTPTKMENYATKSDVHNAQLSTEVQFLKEKVADLSERNKKLEKFNEELTHDHRKLLTDSQTTKARLDLEYKEKEFAFLNESKKGLGGIIEEAKNLPPQAWEFFAGFMPNHPMNGANRSEPKALEGTKHKETEAQACIDAIVSLLITTDTETVAKITMLTEAFVTKPEHLLMVYDKFFPATKTETNPNT